MGDGSFGRLIRKRRESLGLSQARLGELVGRSASTIRNWEREKSTPAARSDALALAAVLGLDEEDVLDRAGFEVDHDRSHETIEQAYASLAPPEVTDAGTDTSTEESEPPSEETVDEPPPDRYPAGSYSFPTIARPKPDPGAVEPESDPDSGPIDEPEEKENQVPEEIPTVFEVPVPPRRRDLREGAFEEPEATVPRAAPPTVLEVATNGEPSYLEDPEERQRYRLRAIVTAGVVLFLFIVLLWSFGRATDALSTMWDELNSMLEI